MKNMKLIKKRFLRLLFVSLCLLFDVDTNTSFAQLKDVFNVPSPEVASLGMFGNTPVGYFTGTPNISVPLYELQINKSLTLPISADYHPANVKPHNPPTTLGIGWVLNSGGYIARKSKGIVDEYSYKNSSGDTIRTGFLYNFSKLCQKHEKGEKPSVFNYYGGANGDGVDFSSDEFSFSFMGHTGSFFMDMYGNWKVCSEENIKVEFDVKKDIADINDLKERININFYSAHRSHNISFIISFTLITPDGTRYTFGGINATEFSVPYYSQCSGSLTSNCWRLSKIKTVDNHVVTFDYVGDNYMCDIQFAPQYIKDTAFEENGMPYSDSWGELGYSLENAQEANGYSGFLSMPVRLVKISTEFENVILDYEKDLSYGNHFGSGSKCLYPLGYDVTGADRLKRRKDVGTLVNDLCTFLFRYGAPDNYDNPNEMRQEIANRLSCYYLKNIHVSRNTDEGLGISFEVGTDKFGHHALLKGISFFECEKMLKSYALRYYDEDGMYWPASTPRIYTDSWGYYKKGSNDGLWPSMFGAKEGCGQNRLPELESTKSYVLKEIIYPTGGSTVYDYELHDYSKVFDVNSGILSIEKKNIASGGLRVKSITDYDRLGEVVKKRDFVYSLEGRSTGISKGVPCLYNKTFVKALCCEEMWSAEPIDKYPLNFNSPNVSYSMVTELIKDRNDRVINKIFYSFTNYDSQYASLSDTHGHIDERCEFVYEKAGQTSLIAPFTSYAFERGKLLTQEIYDSNDTLLESDTYIYSWSAGEKSTIYEEDCHNVGLIGLPRGETYVYSVWHKYYVYTNSYLVSAEQKEVKYDSDFVKRTKNYVYNDYKMPVMITTGPISSNDNWETTTYEYTYDDDAYKSLTNANILLPTVEDYQRNKCIIRKKKTYSTNSKGIPYISKETKYTKYGSNSADDVSYEVTQVDEYGNPVVVKEKGLCSYIFWGHNGMRPIVVISGNYEKLYGYNAFYNPDKLLNDFKKIVNKYNEDGDEIAFDNSMSTLRALYDYFMIKTYTYEPGTLHLKVATDEKGMKTCYTYDSLGRLINVSQKSGSVLSEKERYRYNYYNQSESSIIKW